MKLTVVLAVLIGIFLLACSSMARSPMAAPAAVEPTSTTGASAAKSQPTTAPQPTSIPTVVPTTPPTVAPTASPTEYTIEDVESAGFIRSDEIKSFYPGVLSEFSGYTKFDGKDMGSVNVWIFDGKTSDFTKEQLSNRGVPEDFKVGSRVHLLKNIVIACHPEDPCKHLANNLK